MKRDSRDCRPGLCLVRGSGDVGSAVAHRLYRAGLAVAIHDVPAPAYPRRGMSFVDALFDGAAVLEGVAARLVADVDAATSMAWRGRAIPILTAPLPALLEDLGPAVLVDARMRKREAPEAQRDLAPLTIGLGPGFHAGDTTDLAIETAWGEALGCVVAEGATRPLEGDPRAIVGHSRARFVYAAREGSLRSRRDIGERVAKGDVVAWLEAEPVLAPLDGIVAGLTRDGVRVRAGAKIVEVDPRGERELAFGIGERPRRIAQGVLHAIQARVPPHAAARAPARAAPLSTHWRIAP